MANGALRPFARSWANTPETWLLGGAPQQPPRGNVVQLAE